MNNSSDKKSWLVNDCIDRTKHNVDVENFLIKIEIDYCLDNRLFDQIPKLMEKLTKLNNL